MENENIELLEEEASILTLTDENGENVDFGCFRPEETAVSHKLHTAALRSQKERAIIEL